jgi:hypothetical protein
MRKYQRPPFCGILKEAGRDEDLRIAGEDRLSKKRAGAKKNENSSQLIEVAKLVDNLLVCS